MIFQNYFMTVLLVTALGLFFCSNTANSANPGLRVQVTQKGFDYVNGVGMDALYEQMKKIAIPDIARGGSINYKFWNLKMSSVSKPSGGVKLVPGQSMKWSLSQNYLQLNGNWKYSKRVWFFTIRDSGSFRATASNSRIEVSFTMTKAPNGGLSLRATGCSCNTDFSVRFSRWYLRLITWFVRGRIERYVESMICDQAKSTINSQIAPKVQNFPMNIPIVGGFNLDYSLVSNPVINSNNVQTNQKGLVYYGSDRRPIPFSPMPLPTVPDNNKMLYFVMSNYVINTLFLAARRNNKLNYSLTGDVLPANTKELLRTTCPNSFCLGTVMPLLAGRYPNVVLGMSLSTSDRPRMNFSPNQVQLTVPSLLKFTVTPSGQSAVNVIAVQLTLTAQLGVEFKQDKFFFSVKKFDFTLGSITGAFAGNVDKPKLQSALKMLSVHIIPYIQAFVKDGIPVAFPSGTTITNVGFKVANNAIILGTDLRIVL